MKRTITIQVDVADADAYADLVASVAANPNVSKISWTRGEEIKAILEERHGMGVTWGDGSVHDGFGLRGSE